MKFVNTSIRKKVPPLSPQQQDEQSAIGHMPNPSSDDNVLNMGDPYNERVGGGRVNYEDEDQEQELLKKGDNPAEEEPFNIAP